ncbi:MAG: glycosyltransferase family 4 protein [Vibrio sp.]
MKYLINTVFFYPETNGVSRSVDYRCRYLRQLEHDVTLILPEYPGLMEVEQVKQLQKLGVRLITVPLAVRTEWDDAWFGNYKTLDVVDEQLAKEHFDVLMVDEPMMLFMMTGFRLAMLKNLNQSCQHVAICHGVLSDLYGHYQLHTAALQVEALKNDIFGDYDITVLPSQFVQDRYQLCGRVMKVPFLGVDKLTYRPSSNNGYLNGKEGDAQRFNVLYVGRIASEKNIELLIQVAQEMYQHGLQDIVWHFVGTGPLHGKLAEFACEYLRVHGELHGKQLVQAFQQADVFITACDFEAFGLTVAEAMACGLPVITVDQGGNAEQFDHNVEGLKFNLSQPNTLAEAILTVKNDPKLRCEMGRKAREKVRSWDEANEDLMHRLAAEREFGL